MFKKGIFIVSLMALSLFSTACFTEKLEEPLSQSRETYVGQFKSLGSISVNQSITHLFETDEGDILYAYSNRYDLDSSKYFNNDVEAYGTVFEYESLDKAAFEVQRISDIEAEEEKLEEVEDVQFKDTELGFQFSYPNNWEVQSLRDSVVLTAPTPVITNPEETGLEVEQDYIVFAQTDAGISLTSDDEETERAEEIRLYVQASRPDLGATEGLVSYIGVDQQLALQYKTTDNNVHYFVPRGAVLYEMSFYHPEETELDRVVNVNTFSKILSTFRFLPMDGEEELELEEDEETPEEEAVEEVEEIEEVVEEETSVEETPLETEQIEVGSFREFTSKPWEITMSYPGNWYYSGEVGVYYFGEDSFDDEETEPIITLSLAGATAPRGILVEVDGVNYVIEGPSEYSNVMQTMADSIRPAEVSE